MNNPKPGKPQNIRNLPPDLVWRCRAEAARHQMSLKDFMVNALEKALQEGSYGALELPKSKPTRRRKAGASSGVEALGVPRY